MPVTHGVTGSSPVRTASEESKKVFDYIDNQRLFFYALHETKIANSYSLRLRLTDILNILLPAIGHQTYKVIYKKDNNSLHHLGYSILNSTFAYIKKIE